MHFVFYCACTNYLFKAPKFSWVLQTYITVLFALASLNYGATVKYDEMAWVDYREYPGGEPPKRESLVSYAEEMAI